MQNANLNAGFYLLRETIPHLRNPAPGVLSPSAACCRELTGLGA